MKRAASAQLKRRLRQIIKLLDRKIAQMETEFAATPDPARRPLRPEQRN